MQNIILENLLLIDIETVSSASRHEHLTDEWKEIWKEKISRLLPDGVSPEEFYPMRAAILAEFGKVVCISIGYFKKENHSWQLKLKSFHGKNEKELLTEFNKLFRQSPSDKQWCFTGHNIKEFDIPFLCRRMIINNIEIPSSLDFQNMKPWETPVIDTLHLWRFGDYKHYISLNLLAAVLNVPSPKTDMDGSKVGGVFWEEDDLTRISRYCQQDVATVANIILRFKNLPLLTSGQIISVNI